MSGRNLEQKPNQTQGEGEYPSILTHSERINILFEARYFISDALESIDSGIVDKHNLKKKKFIKKLEKALKIKLAKDSSTAEINNDEIKLLIRLVEEADWNKDVEKLKALKIEINDLYEYR